MRVVVNQEGHSQSIMTQGFSVTSDHSHGGFTTGIMRLFMQLSLGRYIYGGLNFYEMKQTGDEIIMVIDECHESCWLIS